MRSFALVALLAVACSSSTPRIEHQTFEGAPGQAIEVNLVGATQPKIATLRSVDLPQNIALQFEVSNNSNDTVTVTRIQVDQHGMAPIQLDPAQAGFNESIEPGHDHTFTVNATGKQVGAPRLGTDNAIIIRVVVGLANGDSYVYNFSIPVRDME
jgi:hypothetical protein